MAMGRPLLHSPLALTFARAVADTFAGVESDEPCQTFLPQLLQVLAVPSVDLLVRLSTFQFLRSN